MIIEAYRGDGLRSGVPISEPMLSDAVLVHRGRAEMDAHAQSHNQVDADVVFRPGLLPGQLVAVEDPTTGRDVRAKVIGVSIRITQASIETALSLEAPA